MSYLKYKNLKKYKICHKYNKQIRRQEVALKILYLSERNREFWNWSF